MDLHGAPSEHQSGEESDQSIKRMKLVAVPQSAELDPKQQEVLDLCTQGHNVFLTGVGGVGKTFLLRRITHAMKAKYGVRRVAVAATTGVAAIILEGQTLHSLAGAGVPTYVRDFQKCWKQKNKWLEIACLIVDEVSMVESSYLDWLDETVRAIRRSPTQAFGGIQLIFSGDFCQIPSISKGVSLMSRCPVTGCFNPNNIPIRVDQFQSYAFQTMCWKDAKFKLAELTKVFRQSDVGMVRALTKIRRGLIDDEVRNFVAACARELSVDDHIKPTVLYARNKDVDSENEMSLRVLPGETCVFDAKDSVHPEDGAPGWAGEQLQRDSFFKSALVPERIVLKVDAQVMLTQNIDNMLANGSKGVVTGFQSKEKTIEDLEGRIKRCDQVVQAQERASLMAQVEEVRRAPATAAYPIVMFSSSELRVCVPVEFKNKIYMLGECRRMQVPLKLCWALTMHKAQGQSIDRVKVDLNGSFQNGQAYVALSRAKTMAGLQILGFTESVVKANALAVAFHDALAAGQMDEFMRSVPMWWDPVLLLKDGVDPNWLALFESSGVFKSWVARNKK
jgi:ATP-dependent DNA helicase PIF1